MSNNIEIVVEQYFDELGYDFELLDEDVDEIVDTIIEEELVITEQQLSLGQRLKRGRTLKKFRAKIQVARKRSLNRAATRERILKRAKRRAIGSVKKTLTGGKGTSDLSAGAKAAVERKVAARKTVVNVTARKLRGKVKKDDVMRRSGRKNTNEQFEKVYHQLYDKDKKVKTDRRFKIFRISQDELHKKSQEMLYRIDEEAISFVESILSDNKIQKKFQEIAEKHDKPKELVETLFFRGAEKALSIGDGFARIHSSLNGGKSIQEDVELIEKIDMKKFAMKSTLDELKKMIGKDVSNKHSISYHAQKVAQIFSDFTTREILNAYKLQEECECEEEAGAGEIGTDKLTKKYKKDTPKADINEAFETMLLEAEACEFFSYQDLKSLESFADRLMNKFGVDIEFTKHFGERMSDSRNKPCIKMDEMKEFFEKLAKAKGMNLKQKADSEAVLKDIQKDLNMPVVIEFNRKGDLEVRFKTVMRKKNFMSPDPVIKVK